MITSKITIHVIYSTFFLETLNSYCLSGDHSAILGHQKVALKKIELGVL